MMPFQQRGKWKKHKPMMISLVISNLLLLMIHLHSPEERTAVEAFQQDFFLPKSLLMKQKRYQHSHSRNIWMAATRPTQRSGDSDSRPSDRQSSQQQPLSQQPKRRNQQHPRSPQARPSNQAARPSSNRNPRKHSNNNRNQPRHKRTFQRSTTKFLQKMKEMIAKDRAGEELSQASCDHVLGLCVASNEWDSVLSVLEMMKRHGLVVQEQSTYRACLQACFEAGNGGSAREIISAMEKAQVQPEPQDISLAVAAMCRNHVVDRGYWRKALRLLTEASVRDGTTSTLLTDKQPCVPVHAYNAVLECIVEEKRWKEAVRLLRVMEEAEEESKGDGDVQSGRHPDPEISTYREVIECCVGSNQAEQAVQVLRSMQRRGIKPTTYTFELVVSSLAKKLQWRRAMQLLDLMEEMGVPKTVVTYNTVISACARSREAGTAKGLLAKMRKEGIHPNEVSYNSVIGACASTARWKDALAVLDQCYREPGVTPNIYIYTNAMRACAKGGNTKRALSLLQVVKDKGLPIDAYCYTAAIDACAKAKMWKKALSLLDEMRKQNIEPSEVTYSVTIAACGNGGQWQKSLDLLKEMRVKGMCVNLITYNTAITALSKASRQRSKSCSNGDMFDDYGGGFWSRSLLLIGQMKKDGIEPDGFSYSAAISCCGAEGRWEEALELLNVMKRGGPKTRPNRIAYTAAISACGQAGEADHAIRLFQNMRDEGLSADRIAYNSLFSALRVAGDATRAYDLWQDICGSKATSTKAIATAKQTASPDIITVTECIATLSRTSHVKELDQVFKEAVERGIVLRGNSLDSQWEIDLSGMSLPVARAAVRYILRTHGNDPAVSGGEAESIPSVLTFITGTGRSPHSAPAKQKELPKKTSLRSYVQELLIDDFEPSIVSSVPPRALGTVEVDTKSIIAWKAQQEGANITEEA